MMQMHKIIATTFGIGYIGKGGGTVAAIFACICWYIAAGSNSPGYTALTITLLITTLGVWSGNKVERIWGKDDKKIVIDEVAGMCISLLWLPASWRVVFAGLVLFRFFDIAKPLFIRKIEKLPGGWGVMMDDVLAGIYANIVLQILVQIKWLW